MEKGLEHLCLERLRELGLFLLKKTQGNSLVCSDT